MSGKHFGWHKRWQVDLAAGTAVHDSGLSTRFLLLPLSESEKVAADASGLSAIGECFVGDGRHYSIVTRHDNLQSTFDAFKAQNGAGNAQKKLARLAREAGDAYVYALRRGY